jgi:hypothetical protein
MKPQKIILLLLIPILAFGFSNSAKATSQNLSGYVYSDTAGWISLSCTNTNSCNTISYKVSEDGNGKLSGYGYSQNGEWVNFEPNFGGVNVNPDETISGWAYSEKGDWLNFDSAKNISANDLQNEITSAKDITNSDDLSDAGTMSLLNSLCGQFLTSSECSLIK